MKIKDILQRIKEHGFEIALFEDNAGGLQLAIWHETETGKKFYCHIGYEFCIGNLVDDLTALADGSDPEQWEGMDDLTEDDWAEMLAEPYGGRIILDTDGLHVSIMDDSAELLEFEQFLRED